MLWVRSGWECSGAIACLVLDAAAAAALMCSPNNKGQKASGDADSIQQDPMATLAKIEHESASRCSGAGLKDEGTVTRCLADVAIAMSVADPSLDDCPLIGISPGFSALTGYSSEESVGRNCRFLIEGVPQDRIWQSERKKAREFCHACRRAAFVEPSSGPDPEDCICMQRNGRKDGTLFWNMFLMHFVRINGKAYVLGLQHELDGMGDEMNQALWQTSLHLQTSLKMALDRLFKDHSTKFPVSGQVGEARPWSTIVKDHRR